MLTIASINSGSNGNCYYVGNEREAVLIDAGISCREILTRMKSGGLDSSKLRAIFVSHEHSDHIRGVEVLSKKLDLPVFVTRPTYDSGKFPVPVQNLRIISEDEVIAIGDLTVTAFSKRHDAVDPLSFTVEQDKTVIGILTDIGSACERVSYHFQRCTAAFLEANYDEHMLKSGSYPHYLKSRISGSHGHLSNAQALQLFVEHSGESLSHLVLAHLSADNNSPELVRDLFEHHSGGTHVEVASRYGFSAKYEIVHGSILKEKTERPVPVKQLSLFD